MTAKTIPITSSRIQFRTISESNGNGKRLQYRIENNNKDINDMVMSTKNAYIEKRRTYEKPTSQIKYTQTVKTTKNEFGTEKIVTQKGNISKLNYLSQHLTLTESNGRVHEALLLKYLDKNNKVADISRSQDLEELNSLKYLYQNREKLSPNGKHIMKEFAKYISDITSAVCIEHPCVEEYLKKCIEEIDKLAGKKPKFKL